MHRLDEEEQVTKCRSKTQLASMMPLLHSGNPLTRMKMSRWSLSNCIPTAGVQEFSFVCLYLCQKRSSIELFPVGTWNFKANGRIQTRQSRVWWIITKNEVLTFPFGCSTCTWNKGHTQMTKKPPRFLHGKRSLAPGSKSLKPEQRD